MSISHLLLAACDILRLEFADELQSKEIDITPKGQPLPSSGERFIGLCATSWSPNITDQNRGLDEVYGFKVVISFRQRAVPHDRQGRTLYVEAIDSMTNWLRRCMIAIHQNVDIFAITDSYKDALDIDPLTEYPRWVGSDAEPRSVTGEWFHALPDDEAGYIMEARFGGARRMQTYANMN